MKTKYKYIHFECFRTHPDDNTTEWNCKTNKFGDLLGSVCYYIPWKKYCFRPEHDMLVFSSDCLADIQHFLGQLNRGEK